MLPPRYIWFPVLVASAIALTCGRSSLTHAQDIPKSWITDACIVTVNGREAAVKPRLTGKLDSWTAAIDRGNLAWKSLCDGTDVGEVVQLIVHIHGAPSAPRIFVGSG